MCTEQVPSGIPHVAFGVFRIKVLRKHGAFFLPTLSRLFLMNAGYDVSFQFTVVKRIEKMLSLSPYCSENSMVTWAFTCSPPPAWAHKRGRGATLPTILGLS